MGRPSLFTEQVADEICERLAQGESLRAICDRDEMPHVSTVICWVQSDAFPDFSKQYARARAAQYALMSEDLIDISDENVKDSADAARNRLRVDTRKWMLSKMLPKVYGERVEQVHSGALEISKIERVIVKPKE